MSHRKAQAPRYRPGDTAPERHFLELGTAEAGAWCHRETEEREEEDGRRELERLGLWRREG